MVQHKAFVSVTTECDDAVDQGRQSHDDEEGRKQEADLINPGAFTVPSDSYRRPGKKG